jgi:hypothetical protein
MILFCVRLMVLLCRAFSGLFRWLRGISALFFTCSALRLSFSNLFFFMLIIKIFEIQLYASAAG